MQSPVPVESRATTLRDSLACKAVNRMKQMLLAVPNYPLLTHSARLVRQQIR